VRMRFVVLLFALSWLACGPTVGQSRLVHAPAKPADCKLKFLELKVEDMSPQGGRWEVLGYVVLSQEGVRDPLAPSYRDQVRPRACAMGGEGVTVSQTATAEPWALSAGGTTISYAVVRKRAVASKKKPENF
jgi:hypothetical protein